MKQRSFSIIELMIVIAIIAILAAVSIPLYESYRVKARVANAINFVQSIATQQVLKFSQTNTWPTTITVNGITNSSNGWFIVNSQNIYAMNYVIAGDNKGAYFAFAISGLEWMPGYTEPSSDPLGSFSHYQVVYFGYRIVNENLSVECGSKTFGQSDSVPFAFLPSICSCLNVNAFTQSGNPC